MKIQNRIDDLQENVVKSSEGNFRKLRLVFK